MFLVLSKQAYKKRSFSEGLGLMENLWFKEISISTTCLNHLLLGWVPVKVCFKCGPFSPYDKPPNCS